MSDRIDQIVEVVRETQKNYRPGANIKQLRAVATRAVAERHNIGYNTVCDKYQRQLRPHVDGVDAFDTMLGAWLEKKSSPLKGVLMAHSVDFNDEYNIKSLFDTLEAEPPAAAPQSKHSHQRQGNRSPATRKAVLPHLVDSAPVLVELELDVALYFSDSGDVNRALRAMLKI